MKRRLVCGDYVLVALGATKAKSEVWKSFDHVHDDNKLSVCLGLFRVLRCYDVTEDLFYFFVPTSKWPIAYVSHE